MNKVDSYLRIIIANNAGNIISLIRDWVNPPLLSKEKDQDQNEYTLLIQVRGLAPCLTEPHSQLNDWTCTPSSQKGCAALKYLSLCQNTLVSCCPEPGSGGRNSATPQASKEAQSSSKMVLLVLLARMGGDGGEGGGWMKCRIRLFLSQLGWGSADLKKCRKK